MVANGCSADDVARMRRFAATDDGRVELLDLAQSSMVPHGVALDEVYEARDDGAFFCFIDSDVLARRPFMPAFIDLLGRVDAVTSCNVAWSTDTTLPPGSENLVGRHVVGHDGFVYGSSFCALYSRPALDRVRATWDVTFRARAHDQLPVPVQARLESMGRRFALYDTAKVLNILFQGDGLTLRYADNPALFHIGGISQYLSDPGVLRRPAGASSTVPWFASAGAGRERWDFAQWVAAMLRSLIDGAPAPPLPSDQAQQRAAETVLAELSRLTRGDSP